MMRTAVPGSSSPPAAAGDVLVEPDPASRAELVGPDQDRSRQVGQLHGAAAGIGDDHAFAGRRPRPDRDLGAAGEATEPEHLVDERVGDETTRVGDGDVVVTVVHAEPGAP